ncbi:nucleotidyltransferase domain-containing protein [Candidatus Woesearchaeota archaeon]|nr:nucleotidyltransferase domain-containing protein [Candidatus Woesearchaeota archaeon]MCF7900708.1 nucleotidyltransferase domain-containing protein [Candidatus Woesearchaeota archaeon]MCF8013229.1 nucleotidyltransferase domain-containing protein [Candidatus Woesearchaeota archaeon]
MDFSVHKRSHEEKNNYSKYALDIAYRFAKNAHVELKDLLKAVVLFGSAARKKEDSHDIDILLIIDDVTLRLTKEMVQAYRIIIDNIIRKTSPKIHVTSMKFTSFWEYIRNGDPIAMNILRDGYALIDTGFFDPMQLLLHQGRIKPSSEALWSYFNRAPRSIKAARSRQAQGCIDLYWAVIDSAHAALMSINEIPPSPEHVADLIDEKLVSKKLIDAKYVKTARKFFTLSKDIIHGKKQEVSGEEFEKYFKEANDFVNAMQKFIKK